MRRRLTIGWSAIGLALLVLGLADIPDQVDKWADWLEPLQGEAGRWLLALAGLFVVVAANGKPLWSWATRTRAPTEVNSAPPPKPTRQAQAVQGAQQERAEPAQHAEPEQEPEPVEELQEAPSERRQREALAFREAFDTFINTFLERRREAGSPQITHERFADLREEYRFLQRAVAAAYRLIRDPYLTFLTEEPQYDRRGELYDDFAYELALDHPLTDYWSALTFDEALGKWQNADDEHVGHYLDRQRAVLDAFADWTSEEHRDDFLVHLPRHYQEVIRMKRQGYREVVIAQELDLPRATVRRILDQHYRP